MLNKLRARFRGSYDDNGAARGPFEKDTVVVVAVGTSAHYRGKKVTLGGTTYANAEIVYMKREAGIDQSGGKSMQHEDDLYVQGEKGEKVQLVVWRFEDRTPPGATDPARDLVLGQYAHPDGDAYLRYIDLTIEESPIEGTAKTYAGQWKRPKDNYYQNWQSAVSSGTLIFGG